MSGEYIIYCDESDKRGDYYSNFYGGALVRSSDFESVIKILSDKKTELNMLKEVKWERITGNYCDKYIELMGAFFDLIENNQIKLRIMFTQNIFSVSDLTDYQKEHEYFLLYYQFLKHGFGLQYAGSANKQTRVRVYLDNLPNNTAEKTKLFKSFIYGLSNYAAFRKEGIFLPMDQIAEVDSKKHVILQCLDIVLGAIAFRLNNKHLAKPEGKNRRGKRTVAKEKVYKFINSRIRNIYPNFNIGVSTSTKGDLKNRWLHPYRHWLMVSKASEADRSKGKKFKGK